MTIRRCTSSAVQLLGNKVAPEFLRWSDVEVVCDSADDCKSIWFRVDSTLIRATGHEVRIGLVCAMERCGADLSIAPETGYEPKAIGKHGS